MKKADGSKHTQQQQCFYVCSLPPHPLPSLCALRGLESRGKPSFLEPYLSCSLPSWKQPANASRHTDINIISNLLCILCTFLYVYYQFYICRNVQVQVFWVKIRDWTQETAKPIQLDEFSHEIQFIAETLNALCLTSYWIVSSWKPQDILVWLIDWGLLISPKPKVSCD